MVNLLPCTFISNLTGMMKIVLCIFFFVYFNSSAQNYELDFGIQAGVPLNKLRIKQPGAFTRYKIYDMESRTDVGFSLFYKYRIWENQNLYLTAGMAFSHANYSLSFDQRRSRELFAKVLISNNRLTYKIFGLEKKFALYNNKLNLNLGWSVINQFYLQNHQNYVGNDLGVESESVKDHEVMSYGYDIDVYYNELKKNVGIGPKHMYFNGEYYLQFQGFVKDKVTLNLTLDYYRNIVFFYNYTYEGSYQYEDGTTYKFKFGGNLNSNEGIRNHYLGLKLSCSYFL